MAHFDQTPEPETVMVTMIFDTAQPAALADMPAGVSAHDLS
jgi:hypothetical protein